MKSKKQEIFKKF